MLEAILQKNISDARQGLIGFFIGAFIFFLFGCMAYFMNMGGLKGDWRIIVAEFSMGIICLFTAQYFNRKHLASKITEIYWRIISSEIDNAS